MSRSGASSWMQVTGFRDEAKLRAGDLLGEAVRAVDRDPRVFDAPRHQHGKIDSRVTRLDLVGVPLVGLRDLPVEGGLPLAPEPGSDKQVERLGPQTTMCGTADVGADQRFVQLGRELREDGRVLGHQTEERRTPRCQGDHVHQGQ